MRAAPQSATLARATQSGQRMRNQREVSAYNAGLTADRRWRSREGISAMFPTEWRS